MSLSDLIGIIPSSIVSSAITFLVGVVSAATTWKIASSSTNPFSRQAHTVDLANKRQQYWVDYLKAIDLLYDSGSEQLATAKAQIVEALGRVQDNCNLELLGLSYEHQITAILARRPHTLQPIPKLTDKLLSTGFLSVAILSLDPVVL